MLMLLDDRGRWQYKSLPCGTWRLVPSSEPPLRRPAADAHPVHLLDIAVDQALEPVVDAQHDVSLVQAQPDGGADGRVHARGGRAGGAGRRGGSGFCPGSGGWGRARTSVRERAEGILEAAAAQRHGPLDSPWRRWLRPPPASCCTHSIRGERDHAVVADADHDRLVVRVGVEQRPARRHGPAGCSGCGQRRWARRRAARARAR